MYGRKKQTSVALSTGYLELMTQSQVAREFVHTRNVSESMGYAQNSATVIYQDNTSAIAWAEERKYAKKAKQSFVRYHYSTQKIKKGFFKLQYLSTLVWIVLSLTKIVPGPELKQFREEWGLKDLKEL
eukprot:Plantae.Rhodophyta-Palmaria_palmata.ctg14382.p1 GENE.Plantae.Rhodophyta-Palmaria_palmata.ctg14382~~Plantae.Rhodophyta-Palmaria_palmata.ctg14382.p1  ORF type:complete len:128 (+),score=15.91 Plantae.Rhodophyta-Palmaria_palmata.ctg14382:457-840(+)